VYCFSIVQSNPFIKLKFQWFSQLVEFVQRVTSSNTAAEIDDMEKMLIGPSKFIQLALSHESNQFIPRIRLLIPSITANDTAKIKFIAQVMALTVAPTDVCQILLDHILEHQPSRIFDSVEEFLISLSATKFRLFEIIGKCQDLIAAPHYQKILFPSSDIKLVDLSFDRLLKIAIKTHSGFELQSRLLELIRDQSSSSSFSTFEQLENAISTSQNRFSKAAAIFGRVENGRYVKAFPAQDKAALAVCIHENAHIFKDSTAPSSAEMEDIMVVCGNLSNAQRHINRIGADVKSSVQFHQEWGTRISQIQSVKELKSVLMWMQNIEWFAADQMLHALYTNYGCVSNLLPISTRSSSSSNLHLNEVIFRHELISAPSVETCLIEGNSIKIPMMWVDQRLQEKMIAKATSEQKFTSLNALIENLRQ
jgi:hypothetical protein